MKERRSSAPTTVVTDDDSAYAWFSIVSGTPLAFGQFVTATATDEFGNTSEFAPNLPVGFNTRIYEADEYVVNTTQSGIPLHWPDGRAEFNLAPSAIASGFQTEIEQSFQIWNTEALRPDLSPLVEYTPARVVSPDRAVGRVSRRHPQRRLGFEQLGGRDRRSGGRDRGDPRAV